MRPLAERTASLLRPPSVKGRDWQRHAHLYLLRLTLVLCAALLPAFGVLYRAADPAAVDPLGVRFGIGAGALGLFAITFAVAWMRRRAAALLLLAACGLAAWFAGVVYVNAFSADYAVGFFCTWTVTVMIVSLTSDGLRGLSAYILCSIAAAIGLVLLHPAPGVDATLYFAFMITAAAVVYVAVSARVGVQEALREREGLLAEAQRTASLGNWEVDGDGQVLWSDEMYRIAGLDPAVPPSFERFGGHIHVDDRAALFDFLDTLRAGRRPDDLTLRLVTEEGGVRVIRLRGAAERARGRPPRLHGVALDVTAEAERARALLDATEHAEAARAEAERAREEAEQARRRAEELARLKGAFLENMSHEIRTPLTAVIGYAQVLSEEVDGELRSLVTPIEESARQLLATLNAVLDLARLKADDITLDLHAVDVAEEVHDAAEAFRPAAHEKGIALVVAGPVCVGSSRVDLQACKLEYSIVSPK